jgi:hypothetical protein
LLVAAAASAGFGFGADASAMSAFGASAWAADDPSAAVVTTGDASEAVDGFCTEAEAGPTPAEVALSAAATAAAAAATLAVAPLAFRFLNLEILAEPGLEAFAWDGLVTPPEEDALALALAFGVLSGVFTMAARRDGSRWCAGRAAACPHKK